MLGIPAIRNLIREDKVPQMYSVIQTGQSHGMQTMDQCLQRLVAQGHISAQDAAAKSIDKKITSNF
jgi:twitching motility protein PilT